MSGDVNNVYIIEAETENQAINSIDDGGGFVSIAVNLDTISLPYKVYKTIR
jgi:hypothetical protein